MVIFGMMLFRKSNRFDVDQDDEGAAEHPVGHIAHHVIEVRKHVEGFGTSKFEEEIIEMFFHKASLRLKRVKFGLHFLS